MLTPQSLAVSLRTTRFIIQKFYMVHSLRWVFCTDLRTDNDFSLYNIHWLVFITVLESVYSAARTDSLYKADYVYTATFALYIINGLVFITLVERVYSAVRTDCLYKADYV
jgi:hypothetical protein